MDGPDGYPDGTMPDGSEHRLGVLRELAAAGLPAQAVFVYDLRTGVCDRVAVDEDAYSQRWQVERHFHFIKRELHGQMLSLGEPRDAIIALCVSLAAGNLLAFVKHLKPKKRRDAQQQQPALSGYYLALEISRSYAAIEALTTQRDWRSVAELSSRSFCTWAMKLATRIPWS
jgi:hypothetical protein